MRDKDSSDRETNLKRTQPVHTSFPAASEPGGPVRWISWWETQRFVLLPECRPSYDIGSADVAAWAARNCGCRPTQKEAFMTNTAMSAPFVESDFRVGRVLGRTATILSQHFVIFFLVAVVAAAPTVLLIQRNVDAMTSG